MQDIHGKDARQDLREQLFKLLNIAEKADGSAPEVTVVSQTPVYGGTQSDLRIDGIPATFLHPGGCPPVVLYCHAHGGEYGLGRRELLEGSWWLSDPYGQTLLSLGFAVLCMDMPGFGDRQAEGTEAQLAKAALWRGRPLFGQMIANLRRGIDWLVASGHVDADRIAVMGVSMGAAQSFWLGALDNRVDAVAHFCMLADMEPLIATKDHDRHGFYLCVPGLLDHCEIGDIAGLIAPRPQFIAHGLQDELAPKHAREAAIRRVRSAYAGYQTLTIVTDAEAGHTETPPMRSAALEFLANWAFPDGKRRS